MRANLYDRSEIVIELPLGKFLGKPASRRNVPIIATYFIPSEYNQNVNSIHRLFMEILRIGDFKNL